MSKFDESQNIQSNNEPNHNSERQDISKEKFVVSFANTISNPWAMVIKSLNAHVTLIAVGGSRGSKNVTSVTKF